ncbi:MULTISPECIES: ABC transporter permease [Pseudomonadaceae]|uniref:Transport permease protein n=1 Tax=Pseudomonas denitrificans TaxID=43306 RepID=A0A9X7MY56_PSEDE|nr:MULTISPECIES: ABC transporter permease [Pseudomonadaceae]OQR36250.1 antibiotic ABC transporter permease [Pseudomonas sp. T]MBD9518117.1 ABC transporter permease [Pseudomonas sp. PDM22]MBD9629043.1 ABC transporter permease [Pseudomonas sp. PDM19]MBD9684696.1 ABC transporter permease [Pseudomonas sp. PDM20]QEY71216.1 ABC transporter permease [Pseudomonas denitrificans (nom. rej.)]
MEFLWRILNLWRKELLVILKDPANRIVLVAPVLMQSVLFGYAVTFDLNDAPYAILDLSHSESSTRLASRLDGSGIFHRVATLTRVEEIQTVIDEQKALLVIHIPSDFQTRLAQGDPAPIQVILDGRNSNTAGSAAAGLAVVVGQFNQEQGLASAPISVVSRSWYNPNLETRWPLIPALIATLSMMQTLMLTALSVAREREQGTFDQLLVTPYTPLEIMLGKAIPPLLIGMLQATLVLLMALFWFRIPMAGSLFNLYAGLAVFTIACVGLGMSISAVSLNMQQAMLYTFVLIMPLTLLSGLATPVRNMPEFLQVVTYANPLRFGIDLIQRVYLEGATLADVWHNLIPMLVVAAVTLPLASWLFRHRLA